MQNSDTMDSLSRPSVPTVIFPQTLQALHHLDTGALSNISRSLSDEALNQASLHLRRQEVREECRMQTQRTHWDRAEAEQTGGPSSKNEMREHHKQEHCPVKCEWTSVWALTPS